MRANEDLRLFRWFTLSDYEQEEIFLREQHNRGYELVRFALPGFYYFKKCEPRDVVYRLDYPNNKGVAKGEYLRFFQDYGWEYLFDVNGWSYFRKDAADGEDVEIFSDNASRVALVEKVFKTRMLPILVIFLLCVVPQFSMSISNVRAGFFTIWAVLFLIYVYLIVHCGLGLFRLKQKYSDE